MGEDFASVQWVAISYLVTLGPAILVGGSLCDIFGKVRLFKAGLAVFTIASGACALADSAMTLALFRAAQGIGAGVLVTASLALVRDITPAKSLGASVSLLGSAAAIGTALGPVLGGALADAIHWRAVFLINLPLGFGALVFAVLFLRSTPRQSRASRQIAWADAVILAVSIALLAVSLRLIGSGAFSISLFFGACTIALFMTLFVRRTSDKRLISIEHLHSATLRVDLIANAVVAGVLMSTLVIGPFYLTQGLGLPVGTVGLVMTTSPLVVAATSLGIGRRLSQANARQVSLLGLGLLELGVIAMSCLDRSLGTAGYTACLALTASGFGMFTSANNTAIMSGTSTNDSGRVSGLLNFSRCLGLLVGTTLMGSVFERVSGYGAMPELAPELAVRGLNAVYGLAAVPVAAAIILRMKQSRRLRTRKPG